MPKQIQNIIRFEGGLNTYSDARDIAEQESSEIVNFDVRKIGRLRLLGAFTDTGVDVIIDDLLGPTTGAPAPFDNLDWDNGEEFFVYRTDTQSNLTVLPETWIVFTDRATSQVYMHALSDSATNKWHLAGVSGETDWAGLPAILAMDANSAAMGESVCYYVADGKLRACNPNFGQGNYIAGVDGVAGPTTNYGASSLWIGSINRNFLGNVTTFNKWTALPAKIQTPSAATFMSPSSEEGYNDSGTLTGKDTTQGKFSFGAYLARNSGDGTLFFLGRKLYITYTYDGMQESLPYEIITFDETMLPDAPTTESLGYESYLLREVEYGASTIYLRDAVHDQEAVDPDYKNWEDDGEIEVTDDTGQIQTLLYSTVTGGTEFTITNVDKDSTLVEFTCANADNEINVGDIFEVMGVTNETIAYDSVSYATWLNQSIWICSAVTATYVRCAKYWSGASVQTFNTWEDDFVPTGTPKLRRAGAVLSGVTGWVDSGYCSINYVVEDIVLTDGGEWPYANRPTTVTISDPPAVEGAITATATIETHSSDANVTAYIKSVSITDYGSGYAAPPTVDHNGTSTTTDPAWSTSITGKLSTESLCANKSSSGTTATWSASDLGINGWDDTVGDGTGDPVPTNVALITYDPAGEIEQQDENLGLRITLACKPDDITAGSGTDNETTPDAWGNRVIPYEYGGPRLTAVNFYTNKYEDGGGTIPQQEDFAFLGSFDMNRGFLKKDGTATGWTQDTYYADQKVSTSTFFGTQPVENYQMRTGVFPDSKALDIRWKTAVVLNRRVYAGNVYMKDEAGAERHYPDRIMKSIPNSFDIFPSYDSLDTVVDDGDDIVLLETFGGRLLQFKKETLYVIDVTQMPEFLSGTFRFRGIPNKTSAAVTDEGVLFANRQGIYLYNGEACIPLSKGKIDDTWNGDSPFYDDDNPPIVGYIAEHNIALITKGGSATFFYYDFLTKSFTEGNGDRYSTRERTDFFTMDNVLYQGIESSGATDNDTATYKDIEFVQWDDTYGGSATDECKWTSKEYDFGDPTQDSVLYNLKVTYKTTAAAGTTIEGNFKILFNTGTGEQSNTLVGTFETTNGAWTTIKFKPSGGNLHCKTAKIQFISTSGEALDSGFEINDMCLIYRNKSVK